MAFLNIVVPMAGRGSRFTQKGYSLPKPLIPIHGKPMIEIVINNLRVKFPHRFIFLCLKEHIDNFEIDQQVKGLAPRCEVVVVNEITQGAACTVLLAKDLINNEDPLMIANSDQWVDFSLDQYLNKLNDDPRLHGLIMTMSAQDPKWSFVRLNERQEVIEVVEKKVVSNEATVGIYNYCRGKDFVAAAESMIKKNLRVGNEFYVAPAYNEMITEGKKIGIVNIGQVEDKMYGLGIPEDLEYFLKHSISRRAAGFAI